MQKKLWMFMLVLVLAALSACNREEEKKVEEAEVPQMLEVQLEVSETIDVNEKVKMKAVVTQGDEKVADADEVEFEVWEEGEKEESTMIEANNNNDGIYFAVTTFEHDGVFIVQAHVTVRDMHDMPQKEVIVGNPENAERELQ